MIFAPTPWDLLPWAATDAVNFGANGRLWQLVTWNGSEVLRLPPSLAVSLTPIDIGSQLVPLNSNSGRLTLTFRAFSCTGTPLKMVGSSSGRPPGSLCGPGSVTTVTAAVSSLTMIFERTLT